MKCSICGFELKPDDVHIGTGDGTGKSFAHESCYYRHESDRYKELAMFYKDMYLQLKEDIKECKKFNTLKHTSYI
jgi:hypothetical protein